MALIREFIEDYRGRIGHFQHLAETCAYQCERALKRQGLRVLVTSRAKRLDSLALKVENRAQEKNYQNIQEIYDDIVDLAGVRIALYFPQDRKEVDQFIRTHFTVERWLPGSPGASGSLSKAVLRLCGAALPPLPETRVPPTGRKALEQPRN